MNKIINPIVPMCHVKLDGIDTATEVDSLVYRLAGMSSACRSDPATNCYQNLWLTFFFDGTGNNERSDRLTFEHSNVARLYSARQRDSLTTGRFSFYIPGIGTPFHEIGDEGGKFAMGVGAGGEARLQWALSRLEALINEAKARANNPANEIRSINIAAFGFSRGAAAARAFARRLAGKCRRHGTGWVWKDGGYPTRMYFLGLFDTVASVGIPATTRKYQALAVAAMPVAGPLPVLIASTADGHAAWAGDLRISEMVERCVHYCAAHEVRNSFPLDTALENGSYPDNCIEVFYPGAHSDVGGGYRPGEGGRNINRFAMLNLIPLKAMYDEAIKAGVPLVNIASANDRVKDDFLPPLGNDTTARNLLSKRFNHYMNTVGRGGRSVGETVRAHMHMYFRWRIVHIGRKTAARQQGERDWETQRLEQFEAELAAERRNKQLELRRLDKAFMSASFVRDLAWDKFRETFENEHRSAYEEANQRYEEARWAKAHQEAVVMTMPLEAEKLLAALEKYDRQFLQDSARVRATDPETLRRFEKILRDAWEAEPLTDPEIIAFFDDYVTDSLAGFDTRLDRTRATEHRRLYQGGDAQVDYAGRETLLEESVPA